MLKKKNISQGLNNINRPARPRREEKPFTTSKEVKNSLEKSTFKFRPRACKCRRTMWEPLVMFKNRKDTSEKLHVWLWYLVLRRKAWRRKGTAHDPKKRAATEGGCSKRLAKHLQEGNPVLADVHGLQTSSTKDFLQVLKVKDVSPAISLCPNNFESLKNGGTFLKKRKKKW